MTTPNLEKKTMNGSSIAPRAAFWLVVAFCLAGGTAIAETRVDVSLSVLGAMPAENPDSPVDSAWFETTREVHEGLDGVPLALELAFAVSSGNSKSPESLAKLLKVEITRDRRPVRGIRLAPLRGWTLTEGSTERTPHAYAATLYRTFWTLETTSGQVPTPGVYELRVTGQKSRGIELVANADVRVAIRSAADLPGATRLEDALESGLRVGQVLRRTTPELGTAMLERAWTSALETLTEPSMSGAVWDMTVRFQLARLAIETGRPDEARIFLTQLVSCATRRCTIRPLKLAASPLPGHIADHFADRARSFGGAPRAR